MLFYNFSEELLIIYCYLTF